MLRLSKKSEYALMATLHLARLPPDSRAAVTAIADARSLPRGLLAKVMQDLKRAGVVSSTKGVMGGYQLARPLSELLFLDVVRPFEESMALVDCLDGHRAPCARFDCCTLRDPMATLNQWFLRHLADLNMADFEQMGLPAPNCATLAPAPTIPAVTSATLASPAVLNPTT